MDGTIGTGQLSGGAGGTLAPQGRQGWKLEKLDRVIAAAQEFFTSQRKRDQVQRQTFYERLTAEKDVCRANILYAYVVILLSILYAQAPAIQVQPRKGASASGSAFLPLMQAGLVQAATPQEARARYASALQSLLTYTYECARTDAHAGQALQDAIVTGMGLLKHTTDPILQIDRSDAIERHELYVDPLARYDLEQASFVCHTLVLPIEEARRFLGARVAACQQLMEMASQVQGPGSNVQGQGQGAGAPASPQMGMPAGNPFNLQPDFDPAAIKANVSLADARSGGAAAGAMATQGQDARETDMLKLFEIWAQESNDQGQMERWVYYKTAETGVGAVDFRTVWPYELQARQYPFSALVFNREGKSFADAFTELEVVAPLRKAFDAFTEFLRKLPERACGKLLFVDKEMYSQNLTKFNGNTVLQIIEVEGLRNMEAARLAQLLDINKGDEVILELNGHLKDLIDEILGNDELLRGGQAEHEMTKGEVDTRAEMGQVRLARRKDLVDAWLSDMLSKRASIAQSAIPADYVGKVAGDEAAALWSVAAQSPDEFFMQYSVCIEAGSTARRHQQETVQTETNILNEMRTCNDRLAAVGQPWHWDEVTPVKDMIETQDKDSEKYELQAAGVAAPQMNPGMGPQPVGMQAGMSAPPQGQPVPPGASVSHPVSGMPAPQGQAAPGAA